MAQRILLTNILPGRTQFAPRLNSMPRRRARYLLRNRLYILTVLLIGLCFSVVGLADDNATIHVALADKGTSHCPGATYKRRHRPSRFKLSSDDHAAVATSPERIPRPSAREPSRAGGG
jgi:hypothetical protein